MARRSCEACGRKVKIAGGIGDLWSFDYGPSDGMTLEYEDGREYFLCFDCIEQLPAAATPEDVEAL